MHATLVDVELAAVARAAHRLKKGLRAGKGGDGVASAVKNQRRRQSGTDPVQRRQLAPALADLGLAVSIGRGVDDRKQKNQRRRSHLLRLAGLVDLVEQGGCRGEMAAGRAAADDDPRGIDAQLSGVIAQMAHGAAHIPHAVVDADAGLRVVEAVLQADANQALARVMGGEGIHGRRCPGGPATAVNRQMAGAEVALAVRGGLRHGAPDELGHKAVLDPMHLHDWHATILHLLGLDHTRLTHRHGGRDFRLTNVGGTVARNILA